MYPDEVDSFSGADDPLELGLRAGYGPRPQRRPTQLASRFGRFEVLGEIGRGGLGVVLRGRDPDLGREVALKVLHERHGSSAPMARRLLEEARIAGRLQHPGIVPVYEIGQQEPRPYFAMKLVAGETLSALLKARASPESERQHFLTIFEQVCQTVAYAHSRRVIHRDLKPSNVMVGAFGEVQVVDWGLAKALGSGGQDVAAGECAPLPSDAPQSQTGTVVGTWAYMPPEQARGEVEQVDARSDVFALGSILCEILTGKPAYSAATSEETREQARNSDLRAALQRLDASEAGRDLVELAKRCLTPERDHRPSDAAAVARDIAEHLASVAERARAAAMEATLARAASAEDRTRALEAEARAIAERGKRLRAVLVSGLVLAAIVLGGGIYAWRSSERWSRIMRTSSAAGLAIDRAVTLRGEAKVGHLGKWQEALAALREARSIAMTGEADQATRARLETVGRDLEAEASAARVAAHRVEMERRLVETLEAIRSHDDFRLDRRSRDRKKNEKYRVAFRDLGIDQADDPERAAGIIRATGISDSLIMALDDWANASFQARSMREREDAIRGRRQLLQIARHADGDSLRNRIRDAWEAQSTDILQDVATEVEAGSGAEVTLHLLYVALRASDLLDRAERILRMAHVAAPNSFAVVFDLAALLRKKHPARVQEAIRLQTAALSLRPTCWHLWRGLGMMMIDEGETALALEMAERIVIQYPGLHWGHEILGTLIAYGGQAEAAIPHLLRALQLEPGNYPARCSITSALVTSGQYEAAIREARAGIAIDPAALLLYANLGTALQSSGDHDGALQVIQQALAMDPDHEQSLCGQVWILSEKQWNDRALELATSELVRLPNSVHLRATRGVVLGRLGRWKEAVAELRAAIVREPRVFEYRFHLGLALWALSDLEGAVMEFRVARDLRPRNAEARLGLGQALRRTGKLSAAHEELREALRLNPKLGEAHRELGFLAVKEHELNKAISEFKSAIELDRDDADAWMGLGKVYSDRGRHDVAIRTLREATRRRSRDAQAHALLAHALMQAGQEAEAQSEVDAALAIEPNHAKSLGMAGTLHMLAGRLPEAIECHRRAAASDASLQCNLGTALDAVLDESGALRAFQEAVRRAPEHVEGRYRLAWAYLTRGDPAAAAAALGDAPAVTPMHVSCREAHRRLSGIESRLPSILSGAFPLTDRIDQLLVARLCEARGLPSEAFQFYTAAFTTSSFSEVARDGWPRYRAARAAAQSGERQACLAWLQQELEWVQKNHQPSSQRLILEQWKSDLAFTSLRGAQALAKLPDREREGFRALWMRVEAVLESK